MDQITKTNNNKTAGHTTATHQKRMTGLTIYQFARVICFSY